MFKKKRFMIHEPDRKNQKFLRFSVVWNPVYDCGKKLSTTSPLYVFRIKILNIDLCLFITYMSVG